MQKALPGNTRERIVDLMKAHGMTQAMLAEKIGISESTLNRFLTGQTEKLSTDNLIALAGTFHVTTDFLLGLTDLPVSINADIEALHLTTGAAQKLYSGELDGEVVSLLLEHKAFALMASQIAAYRDATIAEGLVTLNEMITSIRSAAIEYGRQHPEQRQAVRCSAQTLQALKQPPHAGDTAAIENTFKLILSDLRTGSQDYLKQSQKLTREFMKRMMRDIPLDPHATQRQITREVLLDKIMDSIKALDLTQEEQAQLRSAFRLLLSSANPGKRQA